MYPMGKAFAIVLLAATTVGDVLADTVLLQKHNCFACHSVDKRKYGPNFTEVAAKYAKDPKAVEVLVKKIRKGGGGVWGPDVMPPQPKVSVADARTLSRFILTLEPKATP